MKYTKGLVLLSLLVIFSFQSAKAQPGCIGFKANFSFEKDSTNPNTLTIKFTNTSSWTDSNTYYLWSYDDGNQKLIEEESHTFSKTGIYNICLYIFKLKGSDTVCRSRKYQNITVDYDSCTVIAGFTYEAEVGLNPQFQKNIIFTNTTVNADSCLMSYRWLYGDVFTSSTSAKTHKHGYDVSGTYSVCLIATCVKNGVTCIDSTCMPVKVSICFTEADFTYELDSTKSANGIGKVVFSNTSYCSGDTVTYQWDYGDGSSSSIDSAHTHNYATPGTYYTCLTITCIKDNDTCIDTTCKNVTIDFCSVNADFSYAEDTSCFTYLFVSANPANNHRWTFGDGSSSSSANTKHGYTQKGDYTVCHYVIDTLQSGIICKDSMCATISVCKGLRVSEYYNSINAKVYPNPMGNKLNIETSSTTPLQFILTDLLGRTINKGSFTENTTINVSALAGGIYHLELRDEAGVVYRQKVSK